jgi:hypothetical protein
MRQTLAALTVVTAIVLLAPGNATVATLHGQQPGEPAVLSPKILAFLKPLEIVEGDSELQKKLKERHNVAVKLLEERVNEYKKGVRDIGPVFEAARLTAEAKLDLAEGAEERTAVLEQLLDVAKLIESHLQQQLTKGFGSKADLERARYARLTVEVELLRAKQKAKPGPD